MPDVAKIEETIDFPTELHTRAQSKARHLGVSLSEYVRYLVIRSIELSYEWMPLLNKKSEARVAKSLQDIQAGRYTEVDPADERALNAALGI